MCVFGEPVRSGILSHIPLENIAVNPPQSYALSISREAILQVHCQPLPTAHYHYHYNTDTPQ